MIVCVGCIQEGDEAAIAVVNVEPCARCGMVPESFEPGSLAEQLSPAFFRVNTVDTSGAMSLAGTDQEGRR